MPTPESEQHQELFAGFEHQWAATDENVRISCVIGGSGPPLLLLHGHPQTHTIWHRVAPALAQHFTVVAPDLRGYGDSSKPTGDADHANYSKRVMARDMLRLMGSLGFDSFDVLAHDRGARVAARLAGDHPDAVRRLVMLDIAPTLAMYEQTTEAFARAYWHWFFLIQSAPLPETADRGGPGRVRHRPDGRSEFRVGTVRSARDRRISTLPGTTGSRPFSVRGLPGRRHDRPGARPGGS